ncbi:flagellar biosynthesis protein FlhB [bacterium]|nr:flagellar biosynthesis protein FlhB [bacterium]
MAKKDDSSEKTEAPTSKRRRDAREKGQVARSQEVNSFLIMVAGTLVVLGFYPYILHAIEDVFYRVYSISPDIIQPENIVHLASSLLGWSFSIVFPFFIAVIVAGLAANLGQVGFHITSDAASPKWDKINPVEGLKKMFSWKSVFEAIKGTIKIGVVSVVIYKELRPSINKILALPMSSGSDSLNLLITLTLELMLKVLVIMALVAIIDYGFQFWQHEKSIRMTLRELRDELKETEGDPQIKQRLKAIQREMSRRRMMEDVKISDVVVTNPTTLAIALKYSSEVAVPRVMAKGRKKLAERIRKMAEEFHVPIIENKPLAWALYKACDLGAPVPVHLYKAVAEILAYVYSLKKSKIY